MRNTINRPNYLKEKVKHYKQVSRFIEPKPYKQQEISINKLVFNFCPIFGISYTIVKQIL